MKSEKWRMENAGGAPGGTSQTPSGKSYQQPFGKVINRRVSDAKKARKKRSIKERGKETRPGYINILSNALRPRGGAGAHARISRYREAGAAADEILSLFGHAARDRGIWAFYCYHHDVEIILEKAREIHSRWRQGELKNPVTAFQHWLIDSFGKGGAR